MELVTTTCFECDHPEFCLTFDSAIPQADVDALVSFLEQSVQDGARYQLGETIEFGTMILRLVATDDLLSIEEPDFREIPIAWKAGVTQSMRLLRLQKDTAESVGLGDELSFPSIRHSLLCGLDLTEGLDSFILERSSPEGLDSGWFLGRIDSALDYNDPGSLRRLSVYQAILNCPHIVGFLALPPGCRVEASPKGLDISRNGSALEVRKGSLLYAML